MRFLLPSIIAAIAAATAATSFAAGNLNPEMSALMDSYRAEAGVASFSAEAGRKLFYSTRMHSRKNEMRGCTTCHTKDPSAMGKTRVGKPIKPISPAANPERLTDPKKVKKWFRRNCKWVLERECTPKEKGDFITYMMSL